MLYEKLVTKGCCGKVNITYKLSQKITLDTIAALSSFGFKESPSFTKAGILYMETPIAIVSGRLNATLLQLKFIKDHTDTYFDDILNSL